MTQSIMDLWQSLVISVILLLVKTVLFNNQIHTFKLTYLHFGEGTAHFSVMNVIHKFMNLNYKSVVCL